MSKCLDDLRLNYNRGLTDIEIKEIFDESRKLYSQVRAARKASNQNAEAQRLAKIFAQKQKIALALQKRNVYMQRVRLLRATEYVLGNWQGKEGAGILSLLGGGNRLRDGGRLSVDSLRNSRKGHYLGGLMNDLYALGNGYQKLFVDPALERDIAVAMWTIDNPQAAPYAGPQEAMNIAQVIHKWQEKARIDLNRVGGFVGKEPGYIVRQAHDMGKIGVAGFQKWKGDVENRLDWTRTAEGRFDSNVNPNWTIAERDLWLEQVYKNLSTGVHLKHGPSNPLQRGATVGSTAAQVSAERVLHFIDGGAWHEYNQLYGVGSLSEGVIHGLSMGADKHALMSVLGPSPAANLQNIIRSVEKSINQRGDIKAANRLKDSLSKINSTFEYLYGTANIPAHGMAARVGQYVRSIISMAKLGGAVISAMSDIPIFAAEMSYQGKGYAASLFRGIKIASKGRGSFEEKRILSSCGVFFDSMVGELMSRFSGADAPGKMAKLMNLYFKVNGLAWHTDCWKKAATLMMAHDFAFIKNTSFADLKLQERRIFSLYGIDEGKWDLWRKGATSFADKREYLTPDAVYDKKITDADIHAYLTSKGINPTKARIANFRDELADQLRAMFRDRVQYAVIEPDARTNAFITQGLRPGTFAGEALRYAMQFKSFPIAFFQRPFQREIFGRGADTKLGGAWDAAKGVLPTLFLQNGDGEYSNLARMIAMTTLFGFAAMTAKQVLAGKNPRDPRDWGTWAAAMVQGGGLGIYGDFLFAKQSRVGSTLAGTLGGPTYSTMEELSSLYYRIRDGDDFGASAFRAFFNLVPGNNLFMIRWALDYLIVNNAYEYFNPGYMARMRRRIYKDTGQTFWHDPAKRW